MWYSSYEKNNYGDYFYSLIRIYQPKKVVELGTKAGYSAYHMARGLKDNNKGHLYCYDLWEKYQFNSVPKSQAQKNLEPFRDLVTLKQHDALDAHQSHRTVDILHIDLGNDGELLDKIVPSWINKTQQLIIIEGGSLKRDGVQWMTKFKKKPISKWLKTLKSHKMDYFTLQPFPSVTIIWKKLDSNGRSKII